MFNAEHAQEVRSSETFVCNLVLSANSESLH